MKRLTGKQTWFLAGVALAAVAALGCWMFGWFGGTIDVMDFSADEVESIGLYQYWLGENESVVTEKEDIQALMDEVNGFRHTGTMLKYPKKLLPGGGETWYEITVHFADGKDCSFVFTQLKKDLMVPEAEWRYGGFRTCRGSMELFHALHEKYQTTA